MGSQRLRKDLYLYIYKTLMVFFNDINIPRDCGGVYGNIYTEVIPPT